MHTDGYTTRFRLMGTPEGLFHSVFTSTNGKLRKAIKALLALPGDVGTQRSAAQIDVARAELWEDWKRNALTPRMAAVLGDVRDAHHGPFVVRHGSLNKFGPYLREALDTIDEQLSHLRELATTDASARLTVDKLASYVAALREAWAAAISPTESDRMLRS